MNFLKIIFSFNYIKLMEFYVCTNCHINKSEEEFKRKLNGKLNNVCQKCCRSAYIANVRNKNRYMCEHNRYKYLCKQCHGSKICIHDKFSYQCKKCNDPIDITIKMILHNSKISDKKNNRYEEDKALNYDYLHLLIHSNSNKCYYCNCELQYSNYDDNLATIERINNNFGHTVHNCVISCRRCNFKRIGDKLIKMDYETIY